LSPDCRATSPSVATPADRRGRSGSGARGAAQFIGAVSRQKGRHCVPHMLLDFVTIIGTDEAEQLLVLNAVAVASG
jgi:hypothetical protein